MEKTVQKKKTVKSESVLTPVETKVVSEGQKQYVVVRGGFRVSEEVYNSPEDPQAISEQMFWSKVANKSKDGTKSEIVPFDKDKHKVW